MEALDGWCAGVGVAQGIEEIFRWQALHVGWPVGAEGLWCSGVALAATLDLVQDDAGCDDEEDAA